MLGGRVHQQFQPNNQKIRHVDACGIQLSSNHLGEVLGDCHDTHGASCCSVKGVDIDRLLEEDKNTSSYKSPVWRWLNVKPLANKSIAKVIIKESKFLFRPYSYTPRDKFSHQHSEGPIKR